MTAIDFADHRYYESYEGYETYKNTYGLGLTAASGSVPQLFYPPLLDDDGLLSIVNKDETKNLLVYAPAESANKATHKVLTTYFEDPAYSDNYSNDKYRKVKEVTSAIYGHLVQSDKKAINDHLLVDKEDFNCPIAYDFDGTHRMWYQRKPEDQEYVDLTKGWQGISLPFTAELVTTNMKGEITHFYNDSDNGKGDNWKGHEYWLRQLTNNAEMKLKSEGILKADFHYPVATGEGKKATNTFLWDYYYENEPVHNQKDLNSDTYLQYRQYYKDPRSYYRYPLLTKATPYILGLPGATYYEFDLSGNFEAKNTAVSIPKLGKQIITFASNTGIGIGVSDDEMTGTKVTYNSINYTFKPSYMNETLAVGNNYALNADGNSYVKVTGEAKSVSAFRPYFISAPSSSGSPKKRSASQIVFGGSNDGQIDEPLSVVDGTLEIYAKDHKIITTSHLKDPVAITIVSVAGITYANYVLQPGETIETPVHTNGVYIVNKRKILVK